MRRRALRASLAVALLAATACAPSPAPAPRAGSTGLLTGLTARAPRARDGGPAGLSTSRADLEATASAARAALAASPANSGAAVRLAEALLRLGRVDGNAGHAAEAALALVRVVARDPEDYAACRTHAAVLLSQHDFAGARQAGTRCLQLESEDAYLHGVLGDANLELGDYDAAFAAFDTMMTLRPNAAAYGRASYGRELGGDRDGALALMTLALAATPPTDVESIAWHHAQIGHLELDLGRTAEAERSFAHADFVFAGHPMAEEGRVRALIARGRLHDALAVWAPRVETQPTPDGLALRGDLEQALGRTADAERSYTLAEAAWISDAPDPSRLARFLAERGRTMDRAVQLASTEWRTRRDIFTADALAWALYRTGQLADARRMIDQALRTGTRDRAIRYHAAVIAHATGDLKAAGEHLAFATDVPATSDLVSGPAARALRRTLRSATGVSR